MGRYGQIELRVEIEVAQLDEIDPVLFDQGGQGRKLGLRIGHAGEKEKIQRHEEPGGLGPPDALPYIGKSVAFGPVVGLVQRRIGA